MARIELNNLEDLLKYKDEIKNEKNKISKFKGKIIDEISKSFKKQNNTNDRIQCFRIKSFI